MTDNAAKLVDEVLSDMVEITLPNPENFLKVKETLTRIGIAGLDPVNNTKTLWQSCHIFQKRGKLYLVHFKELFLIDGKPELDADGKKNFSDEDRARRNTIANLLSKWELINIVKPEQVESPVAPLATIRIVKFSEKKDWILAQKYSIGSKKKKDE